MVNPNQYSIIQILWKNNDGTTNTGVILPLGYFEMENVVLRSITNQGSVYPLYPVSSDTLELELIYANSPTLYFGVHAPSKLLPSVNLFELIDNQTLTSSPANLTIYPFTQNITLYANVTAVSGTSPSMTINVLAYDIYGNLLTNAPIATATFTAVSDKVLSFTSPILTNNPNSLVVQIVISGTSPSFTFSLSGEG